MIPARFDPFALIRSAQHDMEASFRTISTLTEWIAEDRDNGDAVAEHLGDIEKAVERARHLTARLGTYMRVQLHTPAPEPVDIDKALDSIIAKSRLPQGKVTFTGQTGMRLHADPWLLDLLLEMLVENAVLHGQAAENGVDISIKPGEICLRDHGPGIAAHQQEHIFKPFAKFATGGAGLGLTIASDCARASGLSLSLKPACSGGIIANIQLASPDDNS